ncbi:TIGR00266 family protein [Haloarchaeobius iranensis]|uniref:TIGR00266 family protein n=1 Tax=Haloarchaeobius iranensis TaxID=996166 RepID=A0A1G9UY88_9EURY|nr:TIGR00266 family protein [Haloarchaeobius iranensis]SDM64770.1 TIGR00266 family protein [Haloarchaeobius iranensis]
MEFDIRKRPSNAILQVTMERGESMKAKTGAMVSRSETMDTEANVGGDGGLGGMVKSAVSSSKDLVTNEFTARESGARVVLAPDHPGDIVAFDLAETGRIKSQSGSTLAWGANVNKSSAMNEAGNLFSSGQLKVLALDGTGMAFLSAYGSVYEVDVSPGDPAIVDEDHLVAWTDGLNLDRQKDGGVKSAMLGGEGYVSKFSGDGRVWLQTRDPIVFQNMGGGGGDEESGDGSPSVSDFL